MKLYIDEVTVGELLGILIRLPKYLVDVVKEEWVWWMKENRFETSCTVNEKEGEKALAESYKRMERNWRLSK